MKKFNRAEAHDEAEKRKCLIPAEFVAGAEWQHSRENTEHNNSGYTRGCRCEQCKEAKRKYMREYRARKPSNADTL